MDAADRFRTCEVLSIYASRDADAVPDAVRALPNLRALSLGPTVRTPPWLAGFSRLVELELARPVGDIPPLPATLRIVRHVYGPSNLDHVRGLPHLAELDIGDHRWRPCPMWLDELRLRAFAATNVSIPAFAEALRGMPLIRLKLVRAVPPVWNSTSELGYGLGICIPHRCRRRNRASRATRSRTTARWTARSRNHRRSGPSTSRATRSPRFPKRSAASSICAS